MKKKFFNMIEVLLALGVTAVGIMGILAVIPMTLNANRDAAADNLIADIANTKFAEISFDVKKDFNANLKNNTTTIITKNLSKTKALKRKLTGWNI